MATPIKDDTPGTDEKYLRHCLSLAAEAAAAGEVPVGAVIVQGGEILGAARNRTVERGSALAHAEMLALDAAIAAARGSAAHADGRVTGATLYCSLEPCLMCTGALLHARIGRVVFGALDSKFGACGSLFNLPRDERLNHRCPVVPGILAEESAQLLRDFFQSLR